MSQHLSVNGKKYIQSNELAVTFGYTSDYLGKLARDEKIIGTLIGRQWFIEPESLKTFLLKTEIEKKIRKQELSLSRKAEHLAHQKTLTLKADSRAMSASALAQAFVIIFCGVLIGGLGYVSIQEDLTPLDLAHGAQESLAFIGRSIVPSDMTVVDANASSRFVAASTESLNTTSSFRKEQLHFTELPQFPVREQLDTASEATSTSIQFVSTASVDQFADEVVVVYDEEGKPFLQPVFKSGQFSGDRYLVVPVNPSEN